MKKNLTINVFMPMAFERQYDKKLALINTYLVTLFSCFFQFHYKDGDARLEKVKSYDKRVCFVD